MGAGPAGLTAAYELLKRDVPVTVLEKDSKQVGGLARTVEHNGYRFDIGGHRFFSKNEEVEALWTEILGPEMLNRGRLSRIYYRGRFFAYPIQAVNALWNLGPIEAVFCLASYTRARMRPINHPKTLEEWVRNQFGWRLFNIFFKTYTEKVWGISTKELSADWAAQRIKSLDLWVVIKSALLPRRKPRKRGEIVTTLIDKFRYPRLGPGQVWERVAEITASKGHPVVLGQAVAAVQHQEGSVTAVVTTDSAGGTHTYTGTHFISRIPIRELVSMMKKAAGFYKDATLPMGDGVQSPDDFARQQSASTGLPEHMCKANMAKNHFVLSNMDRILDCLTRGLDLEILSRGYGLMVGHSDAAVRGTPGNLGHLAPVTSGSG